MVSYLAVTVTCVSSTPLEGTEGHRLRYYMD